MEAELFVIYELLGSIIRTRNQLAQMRLLNHTLSYIRSQKVRYTFLLRFTIHRSTDISYPS